MANPSLIAPPPPDSHLGEAVAQNDDAALVALFRPTPSASAIGRALLTCTKPQGKFFLAHLASLPKPEDIGPALVEVAAARRSDLFPALLRKKAKVVWSEALSQAWENALLGNTTALEELVHHGASREKLRQSTFRGCDIKLSSLIADVQPQTPVPQLLAILSKANTDNPGHGMIINFDHIVSNWHMKAGTSQPSEVHRVLDALRHLPEATKTTDFLINQLCQGTTTSYEASRSSGLVSAVAHLIQDQNPRQLFEKVISARENQVKAWSERGASPINTLLNAVMGKAAASQFTLIPDDSPIPLVLDDLIWSFIPIQDQADFLTWLNTKKISSPATEMVRLHGRITAALDPQLKKSAPRSRPKM